MKQNLIVIPCGGKKRSDPGRHPARDLYLGSYFTACLRTALTMTAPGDVFILSGKHGLLSLSTEVESYEQRIDEAGAISASEVREQARTLQFLSAPVVLALCAGEYARIVKEVWPHAETPLVGVGGIGLQLRVLKNMRDKIENGSLF